MTPISTEVSGPVGSASRMTPVMMPAITPTVWLMQVSRDSRKVGCTAAIAPSMAKISRELVAPYGSTRIMAMIIATAVLTVRSPTRSFLFFMFLPLLSERMLYHSMNFQGCQMKGPRCHGNPFCRGGYDPPARLPAVFDRSGRMISAPARMILSS